MADLKQVNVDSILSELRKKHEELTERLRFEAEQLEEKVRLVARTLPSLGTTSELLKSSALAVVAPIDVTQPVWSMVSAGRFDIANLQLTINGVCPFNLDNSKHTIKASKYRALLFLVPDES